MKTVDVIILTGGRHAKEINYLGTHPDDDNYYEWVKVEKARRIFAIDFSAQDTLFKKLEKKLDAKIEHMHLAYKDGAHRKAQLLHNGQIKILPH